MERPREKSGRSRPLDRERAFALLFRKKTFASVWQWLKRLGVTVRDRGDVSQDVFLAAYTSFHTYDPLRARPERWLNKITVHVAAHYRARALHRREELTPEDLLDDAVDEAPGPEEQLEGHQARLLVLELLHKIDADAGAVLIAHDIDGIPMAEVAEQLGIPLSTAYKWRTRAKARLREALDDRRDEEP
jgi:RNA polymerase sigma-70 factor (ECF subfamily)